MVFFYQHFILSYIWLGNQQMKVHFAEADVVKSKYREIIEGQSVINQNGNIY